MEGKGKLSVILIIHFIGIITLMVPFLYVIISFFSIPEITLIGDEVVEINLNEEYVDQGAKAVINRNVDISDRIFVSGYVDTATVGEYKITYSISNFENRNTKKISRKVIVKDNIAPVLTLNGSANVAIYLNNSYVDQGAKAIDNVDGDITSSISVEGVVNTGRVGSYTINYNVKDKAGNTATAHRYVTVKEPNIYIIISINDQMLWFYKNDALYLSSSIVTGLTGVHDTPRGTFMIRAKATDTYLVGPDYKSFVSYWMPIVGDVGLHDASWRSSFGGSIYTYNGSHGCINLPYDVAQAIYYNAPIGTMVKIY